MAEQELANAKREFLKSDTLGTVIEEALAEFETYGDSHQEKPEAVDYLEFTTPAEYWGWVESHKVHLLSRLYSTLLGGSYEKGIQ